MCTIMAYCGVSGGTGKVMEGLKATVSRGPDDQRIVKVPDGMFINYLSCARNSAGHCRNYMA